MSYEKISFNSMEFGYSVYLCIYSIYKQDHIVLYEWMKYIYSVYK